MWNIKREDSKVFLYCNGERALNKQEEEFGPVQRIAIGKKPGELVVSE